MRTVYKFSIHSSELVQLPVDAVILKVGVVQSQLCIWVDLDTEAPAARPVEFRVYSTGEPIPQNECEILEYVGTAIHRPDPLLLEEVWHVYRVYRTAGGT